MKSNTTSVQPRLLRVTSSAPRYDSQHRAFRADITLTNRSQQILSGPVRLVFLGLAPGSLTNANGLHGGHPYIRVEFPGGCFLPGGSMELTIAYQKSLRWPWSKSDFTLKTYVEESVSQRDVITKNKRAVLPPRIPELA